MTDPLFRENAYLQSCEATVLAVNDRGGLVLDRTVFYPSAGGQPGDRGRIELEDGAPVEVAVTVYDEDKRTIVHVPAAPLATTPAPGSKARLTLDWATRHRHMRMHTALHLLSSLVRFPVTGGQIGAEEGRLDFDIPEADAIDKDRLGAALNALVVADHPVTDRWITEAELDAKPDLVRTMAVKPPRGSGRVRLVVIGRDGEIDLQPCGGTHVRTTAEIGPLTIGKIEKKGRLNRRIRLLFAR